MGPAAAHYSMGGLLLSTSEVYGQGEQVHTLNYLSNSTAQQTNDVRPATGFTTGTASSAVMTVSGVRTYVRLALVAANTWRCDVSPDGVQWLPSGTISKAIAPTWVGFLASTWGTATKYIASYEFLRRVSGVT
jgi:hypothetical protein